MNIRGCCRHLANLATPFPRLSTKSRHGLACHQSVDQRVNLVVSSCVFAHNTVGGIGAALLSTSSAIFLDNTRYVAASTGLFSEALELDGAILAVVLTKLLTL